MLRQSGVGENLQVRRPFSRRPGGCKNYRKPGTNLMKKILVLGVSHGAVLLLGIALGIYMLPILSAPPAPTAEEVRAATASSQFKAELKRQLKGSDALHWGEGTVSV